MKEEVERIKKLVGIDHNKMLLPCGADKCPECSSEGTLTWVDEDKQEMDAEHLDCLAPICKLELQEYLSPEILKMEHI